jgi:hypothetical protein
LFEPFRQPIEVEFRQINDGSAIGVAAIMASNVRSIGGYKLPFPIPQTQSAFHPHAQRNAFHRHDVHLQVRSLARENRRLRTGEFSGEIDRLVAPQRTVNAGEVVEIFSDMVKSSF